MDMKTVQMLVAPAKRDLEDVVQIGGRAVAAHQKPSPDHRTDLAKPYVEPINPDARFFVPDHASLPKKAEPYLSATLCPAPLDGVPRDRAAKTFPDRPERTRGADSGRGREEAHICGSGPRRYSFHCSDGSATNDLRCMLRVAAVAKRRQ